MLTVIARPVMALLAVLAAAGCAAPSRPKPSAATASSCRASTEQTFNRQNRDLLSFRDGRDTPFSNSYDSGITSAGLSRRYARDQLYSSCIDSNGATATEDRPGSSFSPNADRTPSEPSMSQ